MSVKRSTTSLSTRSLPAKPGRKKGSQSHSNEDKSRGVSAYVSTGSFTKASSITGIPETTLRFWAKQDWWSEESHRANQADADELKSTATRIAKRAFVELEDRLENGEVVFDKEGNANVKKVSARDAAIIAAVAIDKRKVLLDQPNQVSIQNSTEKLASLMEQFMKFANAKEIPVDRSSEIVVSESDSDSTDSPS
jgi:transposase-like protein